MFTIVIVILIYRRHKPIDLLILFFDTYRVFILAAMQNNQHMRLIEQLYSSALLHDDTWLTLSLCSRPPFLVY
jgi:hypothetical protein